jgi:MoxR-like ATPase
MPANSSNSSLPAARVYAGDGTTATSRGVDVPLFEASSETDDPRHYIAEPGLRDAVNVALLLGQPLLVTGDPGTGKTQLAGSIAHELGLPRPLVFLAKTTSTARDLFYRYEALAHFHDAHFQEKAMAVEQYITYEALGLAILLAGDPASSAPYLPPEMCKDRPTRSVVLVDEIDKAPRDLPNDVLNEIEQMSFQVREAGKEFTASPAYRPIIVMTSNSERNLPEAFLRRCVFYHIEFPDAKRLRTIVERRLGPNHPLSPTALDHAVAHFQEIRKAPLTRKPATAECLAWLRVLSSMDLDPGDLKPGQAEQLALSYCVLVKNKDDLAKLRKTLETKLPAQP